MTDVILWLILGALLLNYRALQRVCRNQVNSQARTESLLNRVATLTGRIPGAVAGVERAVKLLPRSTR